MKQTVFIILDNTVTTLYTIGDATSLVHTWKRTRNTSAASTRNREIPRSRPERYFGHVQRNTTVGCPCNWCVGWIHVEERYIDRVRLWLGGYVALLHGDSWKMCSETMCQNIRSSNLLVTGKTVAAFCTSRQTCSSDNTWFHWYPFAL